MNRETDYSVADVSRLLRVPSASVRRAIEFGNLKASTSARKGLRVSRSSLDRYLRSESIPAESVAPRVRRILVAEDNPMELRLIQRILDAEPFWEIRTTSSGHETGFLAKSLRPDLLLLDVLLSDGDGRQVLRLLRQDPELRRTPVLAVTATREDDVLDELRRSGIDGIIAKPFSAENLLSCVRRMLTYR